MGEQAFAFQPIYPDVSVFGPTGVGTRADKREFRVAGGACFRVDAADVAAQLDARLWAAARVDTISEEKVSEYCEARGLLHKRLELAVLREAETIVSPAHVIDRLVQDVAQYLRRGSNGEVSLVLNDSHLSRDDDGAGNGRCTVSGTLSLSGTLTLPNVEARDNGQYRVETNWHVVRGELRGSFIERAGSLFVEPLASAVGVVADRALADVDRALPLVVRAALQNPSTPVFAKVERLLRVGRLTHQTRVTLLYWKRLRDYLIWDVTR